MALAAAFLAFVLAGCGDGESTGGEPAGLEGSAWILGDGVDVAGWEQAAPAIDFGRGRVGGSNGCNSFGGNYETAGSTFKVGKLSSTLKGCPPPAAEVERAFMEQLEAASQWRIEDDELVLAGDRGQLRFRAASPEGSWRATSILQGDAVTSLLAGTEITTKISGGTIGGTSGCNTYSGGFRTQGSSISIGPLSGTEMACSTPAGVMKQERAYLEALPRAAKFRIEAGGLVLLTAQDTIVATFEPRR